ncbi:MAG: SAM-dependent methyltransferase [Raineya sp.]
MLFLIPNLLAPDTQRQVLPEYVSETIKNISHFIVEDTRNARRYISSLRLEVKIENLTFFEMGKHSHFENLRDALALLEKGEPVGLLSEAGCPAIADPGSKIVAWCQQKNIRVVPMVGASSILLALMASGFNGQNFAFQGYLPIDKKDRTERIKQLEKLAYTQKQTQIFIETPFRNDSMLESLLETCQNHTLLCIAANLTAPDEWIKTKSVGYWRKNKPSLHKIPCVFLLFSE